MSMTHRLPVVVGLDGVRGRLATVDLAAGEARRRGVPLTILHVWPGRYAGQFRGRGPNPTEADGRRLLEIAAQRVRADDNTPEVRTELVDGAAARTLVQYSENAQLLVVGHRDDLLARHGWGSTAVYLAQHAACPLLIDRGADQDKGPVVVAASARRSETPTLDCAFEEASLRHAPLVAVHVWSAASSDGGSARPPRSPGYAAARDEAERMLAEALAGRSARYPDIAVQRLVLHDLDLAYTLDRASRRGRLFVAGSGRHGRLAELLYGSVDASMLRTAACPVLLVPPTWAGSAAQPIGLGRPAVGG